MSSGDEIANEVTLVLSHVEGKTLFGASFTFGIPPVLQELIQGAKENNSVFRIIFVGYSLWFSNSDLSPFIQASLGLKGRYRCTEPTYAGNFYFSA